jgi:hypothetical protein
MSDRNKQRSTAQHRRFFGLVKAAYDQWPENHQFDPDNEDHLRAWLLVKAKHRTIKEFLLDGDTDEAARLIPFVVATMLGKHAWAWGEGNKLKARDVLPDSRRR